MKDENIKVSSPKEGVTLKLKRAVSESYNFVWFPSLQSIIWQREIDKSGNSQIKYDAVSGEYDLTVDDAIEIGLFALKLDYLSMLSVAGLIYSVMNNLSVESTDVSLVPSIALFVLSRYVISPAVTLLADTYGDDVSELVKSLSVSKNYYDQVAYGTDKYPMGLTAFSSTVNSKNTGE